jgi:hypothetical protein
MISYSSLPYFYGKPQSLVKFARNVLPEIVKKARDTGDYSILSPKNLVNHPNVDSDIRGNDILQILKSVLDQDELNAAARGDDPISCEDLKPKVMELYQRYQEINDVRILHPKYACAKPIPFRWYKKILSKLDIPGWLIFDLETTQMSWSSRRHYISLPSELGLSKRILNTISGHDPVWAGSTLYRIRHKRDFQSLLQTDCFPPASQEDSFIYEQVTKFLCAFASVEANTDIPVPETCGIIEARWEQFLNYFKEKTQKYDLYKYEAIAVDLHRTLALYLHDSIQIDKRNSDFMRLVGIHLGLHLKEEIPKEIFQGENRIERNAALAKYMMCLVFERKGIGHMKDQINRISVLDSMHFTLLQINGKSRAITDIKSIVKDQEEFEQLIARTPHPLPPHLRPYAYC